MYVNALLVRRLSLYNFKQETQLNVQRKSGCNNYCAVWGLSVVWLLLLSSVFMPHIHQLSWSKLTQSYGHHQCCKLWYSKDAVDTYLSQSHNISELLHHLTSSKPYFPTNPLYLFILINSKTPLTHKLTSQLSHTHPLVMYNDGLFYLVFYVLQWWATRHWPWKYHKVYHHSLGALHEAQRSIWASQLDSPKQKQ